MCQNNGPVRPDLVVIIKSSVYKPEIRDRYRELFAQINQGDFHIQYIFSVGLPRSISSNNFTRGDVFLKLPDSYGSDFAEARLNHTRHRFLEEMMLHDDMIVGDYEETYFNLTRKMMASFIWASYFCRDIRPTFIYMDDDFFFNVPIIKDRLRKISKEDRDWLVTGMIQEGSPIKRLSSDSTGLKWGLTRRESPWPRFPTYTSGGFGIFGYQALHDAALTMLFTEMHHVDDAWLGLIWAKLGIVTVQMKDLYLSCKSRYIIMSAGPLRCFGKFAKFRF